MQTISLDEYVKQIDIEEAIMIGEEKSKFEVARNFLKMGLSLDQIAQGTGLSIEEISGLR